MANLSSLDALVLQAVAIGIAVAAPVGPMCLLCLQRTFSRGAMAGCWIGLGIAAGDMSYAAIAAFGVTIVSSALLAASWWIRLCGSLYLLWFGLRTIVAPPAGFARNILLPETPGGTVLVIYLLTLTNPPTILFFIAVLATLSTPSGYAQAAAFSLGVFAGSLLWWTVLVVLIARLRSRLEERRLAWINRVSGLTLLGFALCGLAGLRA